MALWGFPHTDVYQLFHPERQHQSDIGLSKYLLEWADEYIGHFTVPEKRAGELRARIDHQLMSLPYFPGLQAPHTRDPTLKCTSMRRRHLMQVLPYCLRALLCEPRVMNIEKIRKLLKVFVGKF